MKGIIKAFNWLQFASTILLLAGCFSCGQGSAEPVEEHSGERDNIVDVSLTSIDDELPPCNNYSEFKIIGDTLIVCDWRSTDKTFYAYDLNHQKGIGWFGKVGGGPGELVRFSGKVVDPVTQTLYGTDFGSFERKKIDIRKALADSLYGAETIRKISIWEDGYFKEAFVLNDSTAYTCLKSMNGSSRLVKYNLKSDTFVPIDTLENQEESNSLIIASPDSKRIYRVYHSFDKIRIYDFDGNLKKTIYGPDYKDTWDSRSRYFGSGAVGKDGRIYVIYNGQEIPKHYPQDVLVLDKNGKYLKTLHFDSHVWDVAYHAPTNRLYLSTDGEPQFGYINLDDF